MKRFLTAAILLAAILPANAIIWHYGKFNTSRKQCSLERWTGTQPTSGKLTIPASYKHTDGITYKVVEILPHALDNLDKVTEINIPASINEIGEAKSGRYPSYPENFGNCPALKKFIVDSGNKSFSAIDGMLYLDNNWLMAVPQALPAANGELTLPSATTVISRSAFAGNTTVITLTIPRRCNINENGGLNMATAIKTYKLTGSGNVLSVVDGMLVDYSERLVSFPPAKKQTSVTVPTAIAHIESYAFANTSIKSIDLSAADKIGKRAFFRSSLTSVDIPGTVETIHENTFEKSHSLTSIHIESVDLELSEHFALDCTALKSVTTENPLGSLGTGAFKNCASLSEFPFSAHTDIAGDSVFYACGFTKAVYSDDFTREWVTSKSRHLFSACSKLETIDASAVRGTDGEPFDICPDFAVNCLKLKTLKLPAVTTIWETNNSPNPPAFGYSCMLDHIELGTLWEVEPKLQFVYSTINGIRNYEPKVYVSVTANSKYLPNSFNSWPIGHMFSAGNGAAVSPQIYCDSYEPSRDYICPTASYFVPGGTLYKYTEAEQAGCKVRHNYTITFEKSGNYLKVDLGQVAPSTAEVKDFSVSFNGTSPKPVGLQGSATSDCTYDNVRTVRVSYKIDGIAMCTDYPAEHWNGASVDGITVDTSEVAINGRHIDCGSDCISFCIYNLTGMEVWRQEGSEADIDTLLPGIYMAEITLSQGNTRTFKFILR